MPATSLETIARRQQIAEDLAALIGADYVIADEPRLKAFDCDGVTAHRALPLCVALPADATEVAAILSYCNTNNIKIVPRGAGTGLSGGAFPLEDGVMLGLSRMSAIKEIDVENQCVVVEPGVTNLGISKAVDPLGFYYAPDPSSQIACTIGGNVAENAGGVHCLKYGLTVNNVIGLQLLLLDGTELSLGGKFMDGPGLDLLGAITGSEGMLGIVTEVTVRMLPKPELAEALLIGFPTVAAAGDFVAAVIAAGIIPAGMEMMDKRAIHAAEAFCAPGYPLEAEALVIVELDGFPAEVRSLLDLVGDIAKKAGASSIQRSESEAQRLQFWAGRKNAFPAVGRLAPDYLCMDGTIPRGRLAEVLAGMEKLSAQHGLLIANVFHAGDGNMHPLVLYDAAEPDGVARAEALGADILRLCVSVGGVLTGEHGVGIEKRDLMDEVFTEDDLKHQQRLKCAFDPEGLLNPGKVFPTLHRCVELGHMHVHEGKTRFANLPRM